MMPGEGMGVTAEDLTEVDDAPPLRDQLLRRFRDHAARAALTVRDGDDWRTVTYAELGRLVCRTAHALAAAGATPGARVGVLLPNGLPFVRVWLALALLDVTMVPINVSLVGAGLRHVLDHAQPDLLVADAALLAHVREAGIDLPPGPATGPVLVAPPRGGEPVALPALEEAAAETPPPAGPVDPASLALVIYTSGTTGPSKGVMLSRTAQLWHGANYLRDFAVVGPGEAGFTPLPLFHVSAQGYTLGCLLGGAHAIVAPRFSPFSFWETARRFGARSFNYVGAMVPLLSHRPPRPDDRDHALRQAVGSATSPQLHEPFEQRFGLRLIESYGQTETAGLWLTDPPEGRRIGTVGRPRRWLTADVVREDGARAADGETGELVLRPAHPLLITTGYFRDPETTARAFRDGWYWTGDAASRDRDGLFRFRGRLKDFIRRRGENVSAFEIEREALTHPAVREAAAVGVPSPLGEEEIRLVVLLHDGARLEPAALSRYLAPRLAGFMRPRYIELRAELPRTPTQRVQKFRLREEGIGPGAWERRGRHD
jgi:carnitine-CoA ligase